MTIHSVQGPSNLTTAGWLAALSDASHQAKGNEWLQGKLREILGALAASSPASVDDLVPGAALTGFTLQPSTPRQTVHAGPVISEYLIRVHEGGPPGSLDLRIQLCTQRDGSTKWAVRRMGGWVLTHDLEWEDEPCNSNRDDAFMARCRFATCDEALIAASQAVEMHSVDDRVAPTPRG